MKRRDSIYNYHPSVPIFTIYRERFEKDKVLLTLHGSFRQEDIEQLKPIVHYYEGETKVPRGQP